MKEKPTTPVAPAKPANLHPLAEKILLRLKGQPEAGEIVLGGYLALQHYVDYRQSHDIDAWWRGRASRYAEERIRRILQELCASEKLQLRERRFGDTASFELTSAGKKVFSFQIAVRSVELAPPSISAWSPILIEALEDTIGAKMNALVDRGAPRDFLDIREIVQRRLASVVDCWSYWQRKNPTETLDLAKQKAGYHLAALESRRPADSIVDPAEREKARATREWIKAEFLK